MFLNSSTGRRSSFSWMWLRVLLYDLVAFWASSLRVYSNIYLFFPGMVCSLLSYKFICHFSWLAALIELDRWKNAVWLVSPYKCSLLIELELCSICQPHLSGSPHSGPRRAAGRSFWTETSVWFLFRRPDREIKENQFVLSRLPPLMSSCVLSVSAEDLLLTIYCRRFISDTPLEENPVGPQNV